MFFFILCIFIIIFNSSISVNVYFNMIYICLSIYSITYLFVFIFKFGKLYLSNFNFAFNLGSLITKFSLFFSVLGRYRARFLIIFKSYIYSLKWKPLFKKSSYFGIYRATRNQFLNK